MPVSISAKLHLAFRFLTKFSKCLRGFWKRRFVQGTKSSCSGCTNESVGVFLWKRCGEKVHAVNCASLAGKHLPQPRARGLPERCLSTGNSWLLPREMGPLLKAMGVSNSSKRGQRYDSPGTGLLCISLQENRGLLLMTI